MSEEIDLKTKNLVELKALAYDITRIFEQSKTNLATINHEIAYRLSSEFLDVQPTDIPFIEAEPKPQTKTKAKAPN